MLSVGDKGTGHTMGVLAGREKEVGHWGADRTPERMSNKTPIHARPGRVGGRESGREGRQSLR